MVLNSAHQRFFEVDRQAGSRVSVRIRTLQYIFFPAWGIYPFLYILSIEGTCVASEDVIIVCNILADLFAKNIFGILLWDTLWNCLQGNWYPEELPMAEPAAGFETHGDSIPPTMGASMQVYPPMSVAGSQAATNGAEKTVSPRCGNFVWVPGTTNTDVFCS